MAYGMDFTAAEMNAFYWSNTCLDLNNIEDYAQNPNRVCNDAPYTLRPDTQRRRKRTTFSKAQLTELERAFSITQYPDVKMKESLASLTGLPETKIQVWFQNRRARYFKSKKPTRDTPKSERQHFTYAPPSPPFAQVPCSFPSPPSLPSPPGYTAASRVPQYTSRYSDILEARALSLPAPISPDQAAVPGSPYGHHGDDFMEIPDISDFCGDASILNEWDIPEELEALLDDAVKTEPASPESKPYVHALMDGVVKSEPASHESKPCVQSAAITHQDFFQTGKHITEESASDLADLSLQDLGDFNLSDLEISAAMIDYLLN